MKRFFGLTALVVLLPVCAGAALSNGDSTYLTSAMQAQLGRYALATLAVHNASASSIKSLARSIAMDAGAQTQKLDAIAKQNGVPVATQPSVRDSFHYSQLSGLHGAAFDRQFVQALQVDDQFAASNAQSEMSGLQDSRLRSYAKRQYETLQRELKTLSKMHV
jgi:putative membrane protein